VEILEDDQYGLALAFPEEHLLQCLDRASAPLGRL
jgi:hypothetical protein